MTIPIRILLPYWTSVQVTDLYNIILQGSGGNVGIGGTPAYPLDILGLGEIKARVITGGDQQAGYIIERNGPSPTAWHLYLPAR